jgi:hypothetical protein
MGEVAAGLPWYRKLLSTRVLIPAALVWLAAEFILLGKYSFIYTGDNATVLVPGLWTLKYADSLLPLWNNYSTGGWDRIAATPFGLINQYIFLILPGWLAYQFFILAQILVAFFGTYWLSRRCLNLGELPSLFGAFIFASAINGQMHFASAFLLPAILVTLTRLLADRKRIGRWIAVVVATVFVSQTGWVSEMIPFTSAAIVSWFLFVDSRRRVSDWAIILATAFAVVLLRVPELIALSQHSPLSNRDVLAVAPSIAILPWALGSTMATMSIGLLFYAMISAKSRDSRLWGVFVAVTVWTLLPYAITLIHGPLVSVLPDLNGYQYFQRTSRVAELTLAIAAGFGLQALMASSSVGPAGRWGRRCIIGASAMAVIFVAVDQKKTALAAWITQGNMVLNYESPPLQKLAQDIEKQDWPVRVEPFQMYPAYLHTYGIETAGGLNAVYSRRYHEFWGKVIEPYAKTKSASETNSVNRWSDAKEGEEASFRGALLMLTTNDHKAARRIGDIYRLNLLSLANVGYLISRDRLTDTSLVPVVESSVGWSTLSAKEKVWRMFADNFQGRRNLFIYRNRDVLPRMFAAETLRRLPAAPDVLNAIAESAVEDLRREIFVESTHWPGNVSVGQKFAPAQLKLESYASDEIRVSVKGNGPALLFVGNSYSPYWTARANGREIQMFPANHAFSGAVLPAGTTKLIFRYEPPYARALPENIRFPSERK